MAGASENGGWSPDDLPDLPEEWGVIVIPDDLSELDEEVRLVRAELRLAERPSRWRLFLQRPGLRRVRRVGAAALRAPVLIVSLAVLVTIASLFASAWPGPPRQPTTQRPAGPSAAGIATLPALELINSEGQTVSLREPLPAVILLIDNCRCDKLVADTIAQVPAGIAVIAIEAAESASTAAGVPVTGAAPQPQGKTVRRLHPPVGSVRGQLDLPEPGDGTAAALLVKKSGEIIRRVDRAASVDAFKNDLARL